MKLWEDCLYLSYENPFLMTEDVVNRFEVSSKMDFLLKAADGFVSSEGWRAEELKLGDDVLNRIA